MVIFIAPSELIGKYDRLHIKSLEEITCQHTEKTLHLSDRWSQGAMKQEYAMFILLPVNSFMIYFIRANMKSY